MKKLLLLISLLSTLFAANAQIIGEWVTHTPGLKVLDVDVMHEKVFAATPYDIYYYNTYDNSINHLSKVNGLTDMGISMIKYGEPSDVLFVGYTNANIDIIDNQGDVTNIPDIYNKYIVGNKSINNVFFKDRYAYVCCGFGIVVLDLQRNEVKDTYIIGPNGNYLGVNDLTICNNVFYAATERGIYYANADNPYLADFSQWKRFNHGIPNLTDNFSQIECFNGYVVANYSDNSHSADVLYALSDTTSWNYFLSGTQYVITDMRAFDDRLVITYKTRKVTVYDANKNVIMESSGFEPYSTTYDKRNSCYWSGSRIHSLTRISLTGERQYIKFNGPYSNLSFKINAVGNKILVAAGGYRSDWSKTYNHDGFSIYDGDRWSYINGYTSDVFDSITDIVCVKADPTNSNILYAATYDKGLLVFENWKFKKQYSDYNSSLGQHLQINYTYVTGIDFDSNNNMWLANTGTDKMLSVWKNDGTWEAFNIGTSPIGDIMVDDNNIKWIYKRPGEITVFNNGIIKSVNKNTNSGELPGEAICFATDNTGTVWVGTTDGVALFKNSNDIINNSAYKCSRILIPRNDGSGQADYLLSGQSVLSIAVDGANNLWFGTYNGAIHITNDGQTTLHHFTMENSPLFSNTVQNIAIDDDGNIYFGTDQGIISYKGTATTGNTKNSNVIVYPNPVRPEHQGIVGIKGLVTNALVKITTTNGAFVTHLRAEGGQAVWDCTDINGRNVEPGIYLIFVSDEKGKETFATKVLIMK